MLLLAVALVCTLAVPSLVGRKVPGLPVAEAIAGAPAVGTCVSSITVPAPAQTDDAGAAGQAGSWPVATTAPCAGKVIGEIISVAAANGAQHGVWSGNDDAQPGCRSLVESYLGTSATTDVVGVQWSKSIYVDAVTVGPDAHDSAAGRSWSACVMSAVGQQYVAPPTLKSSWKTDTLPSAYGLCWATTVVQHGVPTACTKPHTSQQLAFALVQRAPASSNSIVSVADPGHVAASCRELAAGIMQVKDPSFGGALAIQVVTDQAGAPYMQCAVSATAGRSLTGSLIGLGTRPLPLS